MKKVVITPTDVLAVFVAAWTQEYTPTEIGYGALESLDLGTSRLGTLHAYMKLLELGCVRLVNFRVCLS